MHCNLSVFSLNLQSKKQRYSGIPLISDNDTAIWHEKIGFINIPDIGNPVYGIALLLRTPDRDRWQDGSSVKTYARAP